MKIVNDSFEVNIHKSYVKNLSNNNVIYLGTNEIELLKYFFSNFDVLLSKRELIDHIWTNRGVVVEESSLMNALSTCRKAFDDKNGSVIKTERGKGYRFVGVIESISDANKVKAPTEVKASTEVDDSIGHLPERRSLTAVGPLIRRIGWSKLSAFLCLSSVSLIAGYTVSMYTHTVIQPNKFKGVEYLAFSSCRYQEPWTSQLIDLGASKVVTVDKVSVAYNDRYESFSFPRKHLEIYCV